MASIRWNGDDIKRKAIVAAEVAAERTMALCVELAKDGHPPYPPASEPWETFAWRTPGGDSAADAIAIFETAHFDRAGDTVTGQWGADKRYSLYLEIGTSRVGLTAEARAASGEKTSEATIWGAPPAENWYMQPRPYLRPAAEREYPLLASRFAFAFQGLPMP